jgi:hypothetical protein
VTFNQHLTEFGGKTVYDYAADSGLQPPETHTPRLRVDYDSEETAATLLANLLQQDGADRLTGLIIGQWVGEMVDNTPTEVVNLLVAAADQLASLTHLFIGEMTYEENEVSWIYQTDLSPLWRAFPRLQAFSVRGTNGLSLGKIEHDNLRSLTVETGGLPRSVLSEIASAKLPRLEHLEIYLGTENYGWDGTIQDLAPLLSGTQFPKLTYLGLRNSAIQDEVAQAVAKAPILSKLATLDLSLGTLTDVGGEALLNSPGIKGLKRLDLHRHYLSDEMMEKLGQLGIDVDVSEQEEARDEDDRYVAIGE